VEVPGGERGRSHGHSGAWAQGSDCPWPHQGDLKSQGAGQGSELLHPWEQVWGAGAGLPACPLLLGTPASVAGPRRAAGREYLPGGTRRRGAIAAWHA